MTSQTRPDPPPDPDHQDLNFISKVLSSVEASSGGES